MQREFKQVIALEIDPRCNTILRERYGKEIDIIQKSVLDFSFKELALKYDKRIKVVGNIPYNIASPILFKLIENYQYISDVVLMVQKEIAGRLLANTRSKAYGILSILIGCHAKISKLFHVSRNNFFPVPKVDSTVIRMEMNKDRNGIINYQLFQKIIHSCFNTRRKIMHNSLKKILPVEFITCIKSVPLTARPEELTIQDFKNLTNEIIDIVGDKRALLI